MKEHAAAQLRSLEEKPEKPKSQEVSPAIKAIPPVNKSIDTVQSLPPPTQRAYTIVEVSVPKGPK
jgi:hypothetical protein